jgi:hypothetical protein
MPEIFITIPANFTQEHERVVLKYFETAGRLAVREWKIAFEAFDKLAHAKIKLSLFFKKLGKKQREED